MKKITLNLLALLVTCCMWQMGAQTFTSADTPQSLTPPSTTSGATSADIVVSGTGGVIGTGIDQYSLENLTMNLQHTFAADLDMVLQSPSGTRITVFADQGGSTGLDAAATLVFTDASSNPVTGWTSSANLQPDFFCEGGNSTFPIFSGSGPGADFNTVFAGEPVDGTWLLDIVDDAGGDTGTLNTLSLTFTGPTPPDGTPECAGSGATILAAMPGASYEVIIPITTNGVIGEDSFQIDMEDVFLDTFQHDEANTLTVTLSSPAGPGQVTHTLFSNVGGVDGLDIPANLTFIDGSGDISLWAGGPPMDPYQAQAGPFNGEVGGAFQGIEINGDWTLTITNGGNMGGSLVDACITFQDNGLVGTVPTITCPTPNPFMTEAEPGLCSAEVVFADASAVDVEDGPLMVVRTDMTGLNSGDQFPVGTTTISFMVTDSDGNSAECDFDIIVEDTQAPTVTCADDITQDNDAGNCDAMVTVPAPVFMDNCPVDPADISNDSPFATAPNEDASGVYPVGTTTVTYSYTDSGGNTITCSVDVTVEDAEAPVIMCEGGLDTVTATETASPGSVIDAGNLVVSSTISVTDEFDVSDINVNLDVSHEWIGDMLISLTSPSGTTVLIYDGPNTGGPFGCSQNNIIATLDDSAASSVQSECQPSTPTDPPGTAAVNGTFAPANPLSAFNGETTLGDWTLEITDTFGGADDGVFNSWGLTYSYLFGAAPPYEVFLDAMGMATVTAGELIDTATDNCGATATAFGVSTPSGSCDLTGILEDDATSSQTWDRPFASGACCSSLGPVSYSIYGPFTVDTDGNYTFDSDQQQDQPDEWDGYVFLYQTAFDPLDPTTNFVAGDDDFMGIGASQILNQPLVAGTEYFFITSAFSAGDFGAYTTTITGPGAVTCGSGGGAPTTMDFTCEDVGLNNIEVTVTDAAGNSTTCTAVVNVIDDTDPVVVCMDFTLELDDNGVATLDPNDAIDEDATVEACGYEATASQTDFSCADIGTPVVVDIFVIDPSGNVAACTATITVVDVNGPVTECPDDQTVDPEANGVYTLEDFTGLVTATDGCDGNVDVISQSPAPGTALGVGTYTITMTSTDSMGNEGTCTFELTVNQVQGVGESELSAAIALYPNPATEIVNLSNNSTIALDRAAIYNVNGQLVSDINLDGMIGERTIDVSSLASGVYMVQVSGENNVVVKRLIIE